MDHEITESPGKRPFGGRAGAFLRGAALGVLVVAAGALAVGVLVPPPHGVGVVERTEAAQPGENAAKPADASSGKAEALAGPDRTSLAGGPADGEQIGAAHESAPSVAIRQGDAPPEAARSTGPAATHAPERFARSSRPLSAPASEAAASGPTAVPLGMELAAKAPGDGNAAPLRTRVRATDLTRPKGSEAEDATSARRTDAQSLPSEHWREVDAEPARGEPLLAVVLVDGNGISAEHLAILPMPTTVAIRPEAPGAAETGAAARRAGHEVLADLAGSRGAGLGGHADAAPGGDDLLRIAVGATALKGQDPDRLPAVMDASAGDGLAWVETGGRDPAAAEIAHRLDIPYAGVDETVSSDAPPDELRRAIARAARQAQRRGSAVLVMGGSEQALDTLISWGIQNPEAVWFAPVSTVLEKRRGIAGLPARSEE